MHALHAEHILTYLQTTSTESVEQPEVQTARAGV